MTDDLEFTTQALPDRLAWMQTTRVEVWILLREHHPATVAELAPHVDYADATLQNCLRDLRAAGLGESRPRPTPNNSKDPFEHRATRPEADSPVPLLTDLLSLLERIPWRSVDGVPTAEAAALAQLLEHARDRTEDDDLENVLAFDEGAIADAIEAGSQ